jgi:hypothetical protein
LPPCLHLLWNKALGGEGAWNRCGVVDDSHFKAVDRVDTVSQRSRSGAAT